MKKILLFFVMCIISLVGIAQSDVTKFLGIPVDGSEAEMVRKLQAKGFSQKPYTKGVLTGKFNGMDVNVFIATNNDKVCRIMVCDANVTDETNIKIRFNILCEQFKNNSRYCSFSEEDPKIKDDENISREMIIHKKRYEALFYQLPDTTAANYEEEIRALIHSKYTKEQLENQTEEISKDIYEMASLYALNKTIKKPVWFMISEHYGRYYITMYYDNGYNRANGEDL